MTALAGGGARCVMPDPLDPRDFERHWLIRGAEAVVMAIAMLACGAVIFVGFWW